MHYTRANKGFSVVEVMIGLALFAIVFVFIYETLTLFFANQNRILEHTQALYLAEAGQEYVRYLRDEDWTAFDGLNTGTTYYLNVTNSTIDVSGTAEVIDSKFTRSFELAPAYRNANDDLAPSTAAGATIDPESYLVTTEVTWGSGEQVTLQALLTNLLNQ